MKGRVQRRLPSVVPYALDDFTIVYEQPAAADLAAHLALERDLHHTVERMIPKWKSHQTVPQKTTFRPDWNWRITENQNDLTDRPRILVFGDSVHRLCA